MSDAVVVIDAGTTGVRTVVVDSSGRLVARAYREFPQHFPRPGWVEHDAEQIWDATCTTLAEAMTEADAAGVGTVAALGITNQRETLVAWSRSTGRPKAPAIVWQDRRSADICEELVAAGGLARLRAITGLVADPYFSGTKLAWWLRHRVIDASDADLAVGTVDSWLIWKLSGGRHFVTDTTNASRTLLFDLRTLDWSDEMADMLQVPLSVLPRVMGSCGDLATVAAGVCPLPGGLAITGVAGDQQAALFGQACFEVGMTKNTYGTGSFVLMNVGTEPPPVVDGLLSTVAWTLPGTPSGRVDADSMKPPGQAPSAMNTTYAYEGAIFVTGASVQWLRDGLGIIAESAEVGPLAASVPDSGGVYLVPAFAGLGSPWWDPHARGTIVGLTRGSGRAQLARAAVDAMALQTRDVLEAMVAASGRRLRELRVDGGAAVMDVLCQIQADQAGVMVTRAAETELTALGAAGLAGLGAGLWSGLDELAGHWRHQASFQPNPDRRAADQLFAGWRRAVGRSRQWAQPEES
ncbi:MAG: FGGY family carbohydrate kinase [Acidimicrobiales bacterium]